MKDFEETYPLSKKISRYVGESIKDYNMIRSGDSIMIGLSGGKDSLVLSLALAVLKKRSPVKFDLTACLVDQTDGTLDISAVQKYMDMLSIPLKVTVHPTYKIIENREERSPCGLCANLRRGILASMAKELGCNVVALGHHKDDAAETVLLNLMYCGRFKCYHPHLFMSRSGIRVIRPLVYIEEKKLELEAARLALPIINSCCPYGDKSKRRSAKELIKTLELDFPDIKSNIIHALKNTSENDVWESVMLNGEQFSSPSRQHKKA